LDDGFAHPGTIEATVVTARNLIRMFVVDRPSAIVS